MAKVVNLNIDDLDKEIDLIRKHKKDIKEIIIGYTMIDETETGKIGTFFHVDGSAMRCLGLAEHLKLIIADWIKDNLEII